MKFDEIIYEEIKNSPRNIPKWIKSRQHDLTKFMEQISYFQKLYEKSDPIWQELVYSADRVDENYYKIINTIEYDLRHLSKNILSDMRDYLGYVIEYNDSKWFTHYLTRIEWLEKDVGDKLLEWKKVNYQEIRDKHEERGYLDPQYQEPEEFEAQKAGLELIEKFKEFSANLLNFLHITKEKIEAYFHKTSIVDKRPPHEDVEVLYHASAFASDLVKNGFSDNVPDNRIGVGNYGKVDLISFTHDLLIAKEISRCLKEFILIANGELKFNQVLDWIRKEKIFDKLMQEKPQYKTIKDILIYAASIKNPEKPTAEDTAKLYNWYLWMNKSRPNPVFTNVTELINNYKGHSVKDVGVVACKVKLTGKEEYLRGESEFRVHPSQVLSIKRVI